MPLEIDKRNSTKKLSKVEIPINSSDEVFKKAIVFQFKYSIIGYIFGFLIISFGLFLTILGISSPTNNISIELFSLSITANKATPGILLFFIGLFVIFITRFSVTIKKS